jgi:putative endonuclease
MFAKLTKIAVRALDAVTPRRKKNSQAVPEHLITGKRGEEAAYFYLRELGYVMVARNWKSRRRKGEIDLVGWDNDALCFIEVKTRSTRDVKPAEAAVDRDKQRELRAMAREYLWRMARHVDRADLRPATNGDTVSSDKASSEMMYRFDVVSVYYEREKRNATQITLFRDAFPVT